jgi:hypothetical protein
MGSRSFLLKWWLIFCTTLLASAFLFHVDMFHLLQEADKTYISFFIISLFALVSMFIGWLTHEVSSGRFKNTTLYISSCWFSAETMTSLGMLGTVIGFMMMLGPTFEGLDVTNVATAKTAIIKMASGMSTALSTTLVGLVCSIVTKFQLVNLETLVDAQQS